MWTLFIIRNLDMTYYVHAHHLLIYMPNSDEKLENTDKQCNPLIKHHC